MIETPLRPLIELDRDWQFVQRRVGRRWIANGSPDARVVHLPHCWNESDTFQFGRRCFAGWGSYRRSLEARTPTAADPSTWVFCTGGFYGVGDLWIDGERHAAVDGQFLGLRVELPPGLIERGGSLALRLDNRRHRFVLPGRRIPDFILYGGLTGGAWLEGLPDIHFDSRDIRISCRPTVAGDEQVSISWRLGKSASLNRRCGVTWRIEDAEKQIVARSNPQLFDSSELVGREIDATVLTVADPTCWSPEDPRLYWAVGELEVAGTVVDSVRIRFGITRAEFRPRKGLHLNGRRVELHGCNRHESIPGLGSALPNELQRADARLLKELGCNFVRLAHSPQAPAFLDACDELGIMVYPEIATWKTVSGRRRWLRAAHRQFHDLVLRDRHHPSVIVWGMGNESRSRRAYHELRAVARRLDPGRPVTYAENHLYRARRQQTLDIPDVWGLNYEFDVLEEACSRSALENVIVAECCKHFTGIRGNDHEELAQVAAVARDWEAVADRPFVAGHAVWSFSDYATEYRDRFRGLSGLVDAWRIPKMAAELFRARYAERPFVTLFVTETGFDAPDSPFFQVLTDEHGGADHRELHVFTNCDTVRLTRDGLLLGALEGALHYVVPLYGSFQQILATGSRSDTVVQSMFRQHAEPSVIEIAPVEAARGATVPVEIAIRDRFGITATDWNGTVTLTASGAARLHTLDGRGTVEMARGVGRAYLRVEPIAHEVLLTASCAGLATATVTVNLTGR